MIIEDESIIAKDIECILKNYGYNIAGPFSRAEDAINAIDLIKPNLILMDVVLKGDIDGIEAADIIKEKIAVPIIYLTAYADDITISRIKKTEPYGYFLKPFEEKELYTWIETTLHKFRKEEELKKNIKWISSVLKNIDKAVIAVDGSGVIGLLNNEAEHITGFAEIDAIGKPLEDIIKMYNHDNDNDTDGVFLKIDSTKTSFYNVNHSYLIQKNRNKIKINYNVSPIIDSEVSNGFILTITEEKSNTKEKEIVDDLTEKLEIAKKELQQFAYIASHDLQEPLRMVASYVQLLQKRYQGKIDSSADEFISFAVEGVNRMKTLLNDLLVYSRLNTIPAVFTLTDCNVVLQQAINSVRNEFPDKLFEVNCNTLPCLNADSSQLRQLFHNLLSNAIKFNDNDTAIIDISFYCKNNIHEFRIKDNGIGMDQEYCSRIFEVFQRLHNYNKYPGTGIGLAICKKIAENHKGNITVESVPAKGSTFIIRISNNG